MGEFFNYPSYAAGEIGPELYGRVDQELYYIGLRTCKNMMVRQFGGVSNRPGTKFTSEVKDHTKKVRLIPFQFNEEQTYCLEFGDQYMRIIRDGAEVLESDVNITGATQANPVVITATGHGYSNGDDVYIDDIVGAVELNGRTFRVANKTTNTFELTDMLGNNIDGTGYAAYTSGGTVARVYTVTTPWEESDLFELNYAQSNDVLTVVHQDYYPRDITRTDHDAWTITQFDNVEGPFKSINIDETKTVYSSGATGSVTITASSSVFTSDMVGELFYMEQMPNDSTDRWEAAKAITSGDVVRAGPHYYEAQNSATSGTYRPDHIEGSASDGVGGVEWLYLHSGFGVVEITGYTSATVVSATVKKRLPANVVGSGNTTDVWALSAWSIAEGYPAAVAYHKQRLFFGGTAQQPNGVWLSGVAARTYFGTSFPVLDDDSISFLLQSTKVNAVRHLVPISPIVAMTSSSEHPINGVDNLLLATDPPTAEPKSFTGSSRRVPIVVLSTVLFVQDMGHSVRTLKYDFGSDAYDGIDLIARSPHLFRGRQIDDWAFHESPYSIVWAVMDNGQLNGLTFMEEQRVAAWHRHETDGEFESVCCIREGQETAAYFVIKRTINGNEVRYVERMETRNFDSIFQAYFVDSGLTYDGRNYDVNSKGEKVARTATTITVSGGTTWDVPETHTLTASTATFKATDVGDQVVFWYTDDDDNEIALRFTITAYTSSTVVSATPTKEVPTTHRNTARTDWEIARDTFLPLYHLEGKDVAVLADGNVVEDLSVSDGKVTIPEPAAVVHIGLPYTCDMETLDLAAPQGQSNNKTVNIPRVFVTCQETRALFVGIDGFDDLEELAQRSPDIGYDSPIPAETEVFEVETPSEWSNKGRIAIRQTYPLPITINNITADVTLGYS